MAVNVYEGMFILEANRYGRDPEAVSGQIPKMIEEAGGEMLVSRLWEERRLAYPIRGHRKGAYWLTYFRIDGAQVNDLERKCRLSGSILRALFVKVDPRIVDTLVTHAEAGQKRHDTARASDAHKPGEKKEAVVVAEGAEKAENVENADRASPEGTDAT